MDVDRLGDIADGAIGELEMQEERGRAGEGFDVDTGEREP